MTKVLPIGCEAYVNTPEDPAEFVARALDGRVVGRAEFAGRLGR